MKFNREKCKVLHVRKINDPMYQYVLGSGQLDSSFAEMELEFLVDTKMTMRQQGVLGLQCFQQAEDVDPFSLVCICEASPKVLCPALGLQYKSDVLERAQQRATGMTKGLEHLLLAHRGCGFFLLGDLQK